MGDPVPRSCDAPSSAALLAPRAAEFPAYAKAWFWFARSRDLRSNRPLGRDLFGRRLVSFRTSSGQPVVIDARCSHMGADLSLGRVKQDQLQCPFHHWCFDTRGECTHIPATQQIPSWARQASYPVAEHNGHVFIFNGERPTFELPFFAHGRPEDFATAAPFVTTLRCPWYLIGANAFDQQHFRAAHDRRMVGEPEIDCPAPFARRASAVFDVCSDSLQDRVTRLFAGSQVRMSITDWCGSLLFATAKFRRTTSYGMVATEPLADGKVIVRVIVFVPKSASGLGQLIFDPMHAFVRRMFIKAFLTEDARRLDGTPYQTQGLIAADQHLAEYFAWLAKASRGDAPLSDREVSELRDAPKLTSIL